MSYAIAAAGTGGHVFPALAVGEALVESGVDRADVHFLGGSRLESEVFPAAGFPFHRFEIRGLRRNLSPSNLALPWLMGRVVVQMRGVCLAHRVRVVLGMGGYVTPPAIVAGRTARAVGMVSEQNAEAGLGTRIAARFSAQVFGSFPSTRGLGRAEWVGNPVRSPIAHFDRAALREEGLRHFGLEGDRPVVGVFGGSLGAGAINQEIARIVRVGSGPDVRFLHLVGERFRPDFDNTGRDDRWKVIGFESRMELFYAVSDLVVARAGGAVAELSATHTPAVLIPGDFGSGSHQADNARVFAERGAAMVVEQSGIEGLARVLTEILEDGSRLAAMRKAMGELAKPEAAHIIAGRMREAHG